jgi:large subunit ribosomal protein L44e
MVKKPRVIKAYCPTCRRHTEQEIEKLRGRKKSEFKAGQRRFRRATRGYGGFPRPKYEGREKPTKRIALRYKCRVCKKYNQRPSQRSKRFEIVEVS